MIEKLDANLFLRDHGVDAFKQILDGAKPYPAFLIDRIPKDADPASLAAALAPVYETIAASGPTERDAYIGHVCRRFGLSRSVVREGVEVHVPEDERTKEPRDETLRGQVFEDENRFYYVQSAKRTEAISTFTLRPRERIVTGEDEILVCDIQTHKGRDVSRWPIPRRAWGSRRAFVAAIPIPDAQWMGNDDQVQGVLKLVSDIDVPTRYGTSVIGYHEEKGAPRWVAPDVVLGPDGPVPDTALRYVPSGSVLEKRVRYPVHPRERVRAVAEIALPLLLQINAPEVMVPALGWTFSCPFAPRIRSSIGHFPLLCVFGTQGSGKTTLARDVLWPLLGVADPRDPFSATDTEFSMVRNYSATNAVGVFVDEYKPRDMGRGRDERLRRFARRLYGGEIETRGRADQSIATYELRAPLAIVGEALPEEPALVERMLCVTPDKNGLTDTRKHALIKLGRFDLGILPAAYIQFTLTRNVDADLIAARRITERMLADAGIEGVAPRPFDNLLVMVFGIMIFEAWAASLDVELPDIDLPAAFKSIALTVLEGDGSQVKDAVDTFIESLSTYAHTGVLTENKHYAIIDRDDGARVFSSYERTEQDEQVLIALNLAACHSAYLEQRRREGQPDETNGMRALRRSFVEKHERGGYVVDTDRRLRLADHRCRCVVIDPARVPAGLEFQTFPAGRLRGWGAQATAEGTDGDGGLFN